MRRVAGIGFAAAALLLATGTAVAQYGDPGGTTTSSTTTSSTTTTAPAGERVGSTDTDTANPGDPVGFSSGEQFAPGSTVDIVLVRGQQGSTGTSVGVDVVVNEDGSIDATFDVPEGTPAGVYFVYAEGVDADGNTIRVVAALVVLEDQEAIDADPDPVDPGEADASRADAATQTDQTATGGSSAEPPGAVQIAPPPEVQRLQQRPEVEQEIVDEVAADEDARVVIEGDRLSVSSDGGSGTAPMTAGLAAGGLVLAGLIALRTRRNRA